MSYSLPSAVSATFTAAIQSRTIKPYSGLSAPTRTPDGSLFYSDGNGEVAYAQYATGAIVSIHPNLTTTRTASGDYWIVNSAGCALRLD